MIKVKNIIGSKFHPEHPKGFSSWLDYWEQETGSKATECHACDCNNKQDLVGAHVIKVGSSDKCRYIVPLCKKCNSRKDEFYVNGPLAPCPSNNKQP